MREKHAQILSEINLIHVIDAVSLLFVIFN